MKKLQQLEFETGGEQKTLVFGMPETDAEREQMYRLRYDVYVRHGYIEPTDSGLDIDDADRNGKCAYFVASLDGEYIGSVRMINDTGLLPTQKYFTFEDPEPIHAIPQEKRCEISRLVSRRHSTLVDVPRNLVMLFLINSMTKYGIDAGFGGGFAFLKDKLRRKLDRLHFPIHLITPFTLIYPHDGLLEKYFYNTEDPVTPHYFTATEVYEFTNHLTHTHRLFTEKDTGNFVLEHNIYTSFLRSLNII